MESLSQKKLAKALKDNKTYKGTQPFLDAVKAGNLEVSEIFSEVIIESFTSQKVPLMTKLLALRLFKDAFLLGNMDFIDSLDQEIEETIISAAAFNPKFRPKSKNDKETRGGAYFVETQGRPKDNTTMQLGNSFVLLATELIHYFGKWYPSTMDGSTSRFLEAYQQLEELGVPFNTRIYFTAQQEAVFHNNYQEWLQNNREKLQSEEESHPKKKKEEEEGEIKKNKTVKIAQPIEDSGQRQVAQEVSMVNKKADLKRQDAQQEANNEKKAIFLLEQKTKSLNEMTASFAISQKRQKDLIQQIEQIKKLNTDSLVEKDQQIAAIRQQLDEKQKELELHKKMNKDLACQLQIAQQTKGSESERIKSEMAQIRKKQEIKISELNLKLSQAEAKVEDLQKTISEKNQQISDIRAMLTKQTAQKQALASKNSKESKVCGQLPSVHQDQDRQNKQILEESLAAIKDQIVKLSSELQSQKQGRLIQHNVLKDQILNKNAQIKKLQQQLSKRVTLEMEELKKISIAKSDAQSGEISNISNPQQSRIKVSEDVAELKQNIPRQQFFCSKHNSSNGFHSFYETRSNSVSKTEKSRDRILQDRERLRQTGNNTGTSFLRRTEAANYLKKSLNKPFAGDKAPHTVFPFIQEYFPHLKMKETESFRAACLSNKFRRNAFFKDENIQLSLHRSEGGKFCLKLKNNSSSNIKALIKSESLEIRVGSGLGGGRLLPFSQEVFSLQGEITNLNFRYPIVSCSISDSKHETLYRIPVPITLASFITIDQTPESLKRERQRLHQASTKRYRCQKFSLNKQSLRISEVMDGCWFESDAGGLIAVGVMRYPFIPEVRGLLQVTESQGHCEIEIEFDRQSKVSDAFSKVVLQALMFSLI